LQFLAIKTLDPDLQLEKMVDPDPHLTSAAPNFFTLVGGGGMGEEPNHHTTARKPGPL
jgi:hypothetical protein